MCAGRRLSTRIKVCDLAVAVAAVVVVGGIGIVLRRVLLLLRSVWLEGGLGRAVLAGGMMVGHVGTTVVVAWWWWWCCCC